MSRQGNWKGSFYATVILKQSKDMHAQMKINRTKHKHYPESTIWTLKIRLGLSIASIPPKGTIFYNRWCFLFQHSFAAFPVYKHLNQHNRKLMKEWMDTFNPSNIWSPNGAVWVWYVTAYTSSTWGHVYHVFACLIPYMRTNLPSPGTL